MKLYNPNVLLTFIIGTLWLLLTPIATYSQLRISTVCASNQHQSAADSSYYDYIVFHNHSEAVIDLSTFTVGVGNEKHLITNPPQLLPNDSSIIWCAGKKVELAQAHIKNKLPKSGGRITLTTDLDTIQEVTYPPLFQNEVLHIKENGAFYLVNSPQEHAERLTYIYTHGSIDSLGVQNDSAPFVKASPPNIPVRYPEIESYLPTHTIDVISIVADPLELSGWFGINKKPHDQQRIACRFEIPNRDFSSAGQLMVHAPNQNQQRSYRITAKAAHGPATFHHSLFPNKEIDEINSFVLRTGGDDGINTGGLGLRDLLATQIALAVNPDLIRSAGTPTITYLNGEYYGIHNLRARFDQDYLKAHGDFDLYIERDAKSHSTYIYGGEQDSIAWHQLDMLAHDILSGERLPQEMTRHFESDQIIDYFILEIYSGNQDWLTNNMRFVRDANTKRWRPIVNDLDWGFGRFNNFPSGKSHWNALEFSLSPTAGWDDHQPSNTFFRAMMMDQRLHKQFIDRFVFLLNTSLHHKQVITKLDSLHRLIAPELPEHFLKWEINADDYEEELDRAKAWIYHRHQHLLDHLASYQQNKMIEYTVLASAERHSLQYNGHVTPRINFAAAANDSVHFELDLAENLKLLGWSIKLDSDAPELSSTDPSITVVSDTNTAIAPLLLPKDLLKNPERFRVSVKYYTMDELWTGMSEVKTRRILCINEQKPGTGPRCAFTPKKMALVGNTGYPKDYIVVVEKFRKELRFHFFVN
ncbi:CotH kinase family protein [Sanyastnella coralliicola]|uniref:CotH kinase family protein n=1 Tax=Sanyastnella coralliicola TaxID=3069118 RepID=UPI0027BA1BB6|nr:CotH kinase family protein [Longitalea sp. SCSIO 12813]